MGKVGILSDYADVTVLIDRLLTPGHEVVTMERSLLPDVDPREVPDVVIVPLFRLPHVHARAIESFCDDIAGGKLLKEIWKVMDGHKRPIIVFGIGVVPDEVPSEMHYHAFLTFPQAIQELNPLISALIGPPPTSARSAC